MVNEIVLDSKRLLLCINTSDSFSVFTCIEILHQSGGTTVSTNSGLRICYTYQDVLAKDANFNFSSLDFLQDVPEKTKESAGGRWEFLGLLPLFDPPRHDSAETIRRALNLGVSVKMITGRVCSRHQALSL